MGQLLSPEPTIWALRKNTRKEDEGRAESGTLYEHIFGYDPIRINNANGDNDAIQKGCSENPKLNLINPQTNFAVVEIASDLPPEEA